MAKPWLIGLVACLSACGYMTPPIWYRLEYASVEKEANKRFRIGASATDFEAWFAEKSKSKAPPKRGQFRMQQRCEPRSMALACIEGCVYIMMANYCVNEYDRLAELTFSDGGNC